MAEVSTIGSSLKIENFIKNLTVKDRKPIDNLESKKTKLKAKSTVLSDLKLNLSTLRTRLKGFTSIGTDAILEAKTATSSDNSIFTASADSTANKGNHTLEISRIAKNDLVVTDVFKKTQTKLADEFDGQTQKFTLAVGENETIEISIKFEDNSETDKEVLERISNKINSIVDDVSSSVISNGKNKVRLSITTDNSGSDNQLIFSAESDQRLLSEIGIFDKPTGNNSIVFERIDATNSEGGYITELVDDLDALINVNGIEITSSKNTITGVIKGITINLRKTTSGEETISVDSNSKEVKDQVKGFIKDYNSALSFINEKLSINNSTKKRGELAGNSSIIKLKFDLREIVSEQVLGIDSSDASYLTEIGLKINNNGTLKIGNEDKFDDLLESDSTSIINLFSSDNGLSNKLITILDRFTKTGSRIDSEISTIKSQVSSIDTQINRFEDRFSLKESKLKKQFIQLEKTLALLNSQQSFIQRFSTIFSPFLRKSTLGINTLTTRKF